MLMTVMFKDQILFLFLSRRRLEDLSSFVFRDYLFIPFA